MHAPASNQALAAQPAATAYTVEAADLARDAAQVVVLWDGALESTQGAAKYDWFYRRRPGAPAAVLFARVAGAAAPVGTLGMGPRVMLAGRERVSAAVLSDFAVVPAHRTVLPALRLQTEMLGLALRQHALAFGFPNRKAAPVLKRVGYRQVAEMTRYARVLRTAAYLPARLPAWVRAWAGFAADTLRTLRFDARGWIASLGQAGGWRTAPDPAFDRLWARVAEHNTWLIGVRDREFLAWRFGAEPGKRHRYYVLEARAAGELDGYAVCERADTVLHVRDLLAATPAALTRLLARLMAAAYREGVESVSLEFCDAAPVRAALLAAGMSPRDARAVHASIAPARADALGACAWYLTCADEDA